MESRDSEVVLQKARAYAFLLLKFRPRSEKELAERLGRKKFDAAVIKETVTFLKEKRFIDDREFARAWIQSRLKKPFGLRRIRQELKRKGIADSVVTGQMQEIKKDYREQELVSVLAQERLKRLGAIEPQKARQRIYAYLLRRGFSPDVVIEVLHSL